MNEMHNGLMGLVGIIAIGFTFAFIVAMGFAVIHGWGFFSELVTNRIVAMRLKRKQMLAAEQEIDYLLSGSHTNAQTYVLDRR